MIFSVFRRMAFFEEAGSLDNHRFRVGALLEFYNAITRLIPSKCCIFFGMTQHLEYSIVDDLTLTFECGDIDWTTHKFRFVPQKIGPFLELNLFQKGQLVKVAENILLDSEGLDEFRQPFKERRRIWISGHKSVGLFCCRKGEEEGEETVEWRSFCATADLAMKKAGFYETTAGLIVAAIRELKENIFLHSLDEQTGILAFRCSQGNFEFVVADTGVGVLASLQKHKDYSVIRDHGRALELAITDGHSRFGRESGHGFGFRPLFLALAERGGNIRFRSGDHALIIRGRGNDRTEKQIFQKSYFHGFVVSADFTTGVPL